MIALICSTFATLLLCFNFGVFFAKKLNLSIGLIENFFLGLVLVNSITSYISIFFPINIFVLIIELGFAVFLSFANFKEISVVLQKLKSHSYILFISTPFLLWGFINALSEPLNADSPLYHLQAIKWIEEYAVVPGLGNLHGRFGFNPNVFTLYALTSLKDIFQQEIFSINFTLFAIFVIYFIKNAFVRFSIEGFSNIFFYNILLLVSILALVFNVSSPTPDFLCICLPIFIFAKIINGNYTLQNLDFKHFTFILVIAAYSVTVKLATFPLFILPISLVFLKQFPVKKIVFPAVFSIIIFAPWLIRNVIISGWLVYPFPSIDLFNFDWKVPISKVINEKELIIGFARNGGKHMVETSKLPVNEWIGQWWQAVYIYEKPIILAAIIFPILIFSLGLLKIVKADILKFIVLITSFFGLIFWFFLAPDFRFGMAFILVSALSPLYFFQFNLLKKLSIFPEKKIIFTGLFIVLFGLVFVKSNFFTIKNSKKISERIVCPEEMKKPENIDFKAITVGGINFFYPTADDECYNHSLPCGAYDYDKIKLRGNKLSEGFMADK